MKGKFAPRYISLLEVIRKIWTSILLVGITSYDFKGAWSVSCIITLEGHGRPFVCIAISPNGDPRWLNSGNEADNDYG